MIVKQTRVYLVFKYLVYLALSYNVFSFAVEAIAGAEIVYDGAPTIGQFIVAYADPIDTAAWLVLLLMLELETFVIEDENLDGPLYWTINAVNTICYVIIIYSLYGYVGTLIDVPMSFTSFSGDACAAIGGDASFLLRLDEYQPLSADNCVLISETAHYSESLNMYATPSALELTSLLAWTDVVNSATWIIVVGVLQLEVYLQSSKLYGTRFFTAYKSSKIVLYGVLFVCCVIWWFNGHPLDAWDATLWLIAFFFIEVNVLNWQEENARKREALSITEPVTTS